MSEYISSLNGGQLSPLLDSRTDLPVYRSGCKTLRNFYVLPQGGVERRQGSQYLKDAITTEGKLIPFIFTRDDSYMLEFGDSIVNIYDGDGVLVQTLDTLYTNDDLKDIKYLQIADILWLVSPRIPPQNIKRLNIDPLDFEIDTVTFDFPPLLEENEDGTSTISFEPILFDTAVNYDVEDESTVILGTGEHTYWEAIVPVPSGLPFDASDWVQKTIDAVDTSTGSNISLYSNTGIFHPDQVSAYFRTSHQRANETLASEGSVNGGNYTSEPLYIKNNTVKVTSSANTVQIGRGTLTSTVTVQTKEGVTGTWGTVATYSYGTHTTTVVGLLDTYVRVILTSETWIVGGQVYRQSSANFSILVPLGRRIDFTATANKTSEELDVSFSDWEITTGGTWTGSMELEKSTDAGGTWYTVSTILDTYGIDAGNVTLNSISREGNNTLIRLKYEHKSGTVTANMVNMTLNSEELYQIDEYVDENRINVYVIQEPITNYTTNAWSEGAFSKYRGYPIAIELYGNRLVYSGTIEEPNYVYMSYTDDYFNFLTGVRDSEAIKVKPNTNEPTAWLLSRGLSLYQGTRGSVILIRPSGDKGITPSSITANESLEFGGSDIQALKTNETVVFLERLNTKLREVFFSDEEQSLVSRDMTIMTNEIAGPHGFTELTLQRTPDQIIYGLREDGLLAGLTYERSQEVFGWSIMNFGGTIKSIAVRPTGSHDELWMIIERDSGTFVEKLGTRVFSDDLLDAWYVDSGVKEVLVGTQSTTNITVDVNEHFVVTSESHGLTDGDIVRFSNTTDADWLDDRILQVGDATTDTFTLKDIYGEYLDAWVLYNDYIGTGAGNSSGNGNYVTTNGIGYSIYDNNGLQTGYSTYRGFPHNSWELFDVIGIGAMYYNNAPGGKFPSTGWLVSPTATGIAPAPTLTLGPATMSGDFTQVSKEWTGLDHLEGELVQIQGDGGYAGTATVVGGSITTDAYYNQTVIGLRYLSILQPMYIESTGFASNRWNKVILDASITFYRSIGGYAGLLVQIDDRDPEFDFDTLDDNFPNVDQLYYDMEPLNFRKSSDATDGPIKPFNGNKLVNYNDTYSRVKTQFVIQDIPMPMIVQGLAVNLKMGG